MVQLPFSISHAQFNAALFALQLVVNFNQNAFTPADKDRNPWTWTTLIQPAGVAFAIWLVIYVFTTLLVVVDVFCPKYSLFTDAPSLRVYFTAACIVNMGWLVLFNWLRWVHVAAIDLAAMWAALLPLYLYSTHLTATSVVPWQQFVCSHLAVRLYFSWVSAAVMLNVSISLQTLHGAFLSFEIYASILALLLTIVLSGIVYRHDHVIGVVAMWALFWLTRRTGTFTDDAQATLVKVQAGAFIGLVVVAMTMVVAVLHRHCSPQWIQLTSADALKPLLGK